MKVAKIAAKNGASFATFGKNATRDFSTKSRRLGGIFGGIRNSRSNNMQAA
ncbi:MAG: hypothetical protein ACN6O2_06345 [Stenotrophomonas sp.]